MGENSKIEWTHHTFNPWLGCTKVSPACQHCYAESWAKRTGIVKWGDSADRRRTTDAYWRQPMKWNAAALTSGERRRVFCASLADVFEDRDELKPWRKELFDLIYATPMLDWLLLTKRPHNIGVMLRDARVAAYEFPPNVWLGTTVESDEYRYRIDDLIENGGALARVLFLSCEPLLGPLDLSANQRFQFEHGGHQPLIDDLDWIICGGESGGHARPMDPGWARSLRDQCVKARRAFHFKQWGSWEPFSLAPAPDTPEIDPSWHDWGNGDFSARVGKKLAGRLLDGRTWDGFPK